MLRWSIADAVAFDESEDDGLAGGAPAAFALAGPAEGGLVALDLAPERFPESLFVGHTRAGQAVEPLDRRRAGQRSVALPVDRDTQDEAFEELVLDAGGEPAGAPRGDGPESVPTLPAPKPPVTEPIRPGKQALWALGHRQILADLVQIG